MPRGKYDYKLTAEEMSEILGYNIQHIRRLANKGLIPAIKRGRKWYFSESAMLIFYETKTERERQKKLTRTKGHPTSNGGVAETSSLFR